MKRLTRVVGGALLIALFLGWIYIRDHTALAAHLPADEPLRFVAHLIAWGSLLVGDSLIASAWATKTEVQRED
ncbi:hypothetical protein D6T64_03160 [Cryobacterium melibiosiphilum]|uniref:Uncharacterized protein n=1 Tax=Cryobacterium melibiosiphilum TaxID=995039 RepID=A0A3A5MKX1_9MICO|nr:hypothetical protein [Cryobacterium melibiosiphilum]RJT90747.1 hypothetical protein D6T64_03160 [Cryobacterium melibiosiphilum]